MGKRIVAVMHCMLRLKRRCRRCRTYGRLLQVSAEILTSVLACISIGSALPVQRDYLRDCVEMFAASPDSEYVACVRDDNTISVWSVVKQALIDTYDVTPFTSRSWSAVMAIDLSPRAASVTVLLDDGSVVWFSKKSSKGVHSSRPSGIGHPLAGRLIDDGTIAVIVTDTSGIITVNNVTGHVIRRVTVAARKPVFASVSQSGFVAAISSGPGMLRLYDTRTGFGVSRSVSAAIMVNRADFSSDCTRFICVDKQGSLCI